MAQRETTTAAIRPFHINVPDEALVDLRRRINATKWPERETVFAPKNVPVPAAVSAFPDDLYQCPRSWAEQAYPKLIHYNKLDKGGYFAAWEQPELFTTEIRAAFRSLR